MPPSILLLGASGNVGPHIITALLAQRTQFSRIAILSDPSKVSKFASAKAQGAEIISGSFTDPSSFKGFNTVISLLGTPVIPSQPAIITAAITAGVTHFYPSEIGLDISTPELNQERYFQGKLATRRHLDETIQKNPGFGYTLLLIGMITEFVVVTPLFGVDRDKQKVDFVGSAESRITLTSFRDVATALVNSLHTTSAGGRTLKIESETLTAAKLFETLAAAQDVPYNVAYTDPAKAKELEASFERDGNGYLAGLMSLKVAVAVRGWLDGDVDGGEGRESARETFKRLEGSG